MNADRLLHDIEEARALRHPERLMRVTLECGHLRLMKWVSTVMGIGAMTSCRLCDSAVRTVVNVEETGRLGYSS